VEGLELTMSALPDPGFWRGRRVLLTGHTGFKGGWMALWLEALGAKVTGLALAPDTDPSLFALAGVETSLTSLIADLRDRSAVERVVASANPQIVLHLAAQPLVRRSLREPVETVATNVLGTAHLLDALRGRDGLEAVLAVTSDKVYANAGRGEAFVESDPLGGKDPYSASKAAAEIVTASFARSYFAERGVPVATARGGNVVGGGDFSEDRIVPDIVRAARSGETLVLRHPEAVRPWQHVLDCICGYLVYAERLTQTPDLPSALNFGPAPDDPVSVGAFADAMQTALGVSGGWGHEPVPGSVEARMLTLDSTAARALLDWRDRLPGQACIDATAAWYKANFDGADMRAASFAAIAVYEAIP
jgi:CDP-glucose 4,6-dehydratase